MRLMNSARRWLAHHLQIGVVVLSALGIANSASSAEATRMVVLKGATIIDGTGAQPIEGSIAITNGLITAIGATREVRTRGAKVIDVSGKYIVPGLMDANVHLFYAPSPDVLYGYDGHYDELILEAAQVALKSGVTTVFDTWGPREYLVKVRDAINAGGRTGSRIFLAGNIVGFGSPTSNDFLPPLRTILPKVDTDRFDAIWEQGVGSDLLWKTPQQVRERVHNYIQNGHLDFVKYAASGHKEGQFIAFSAEVQKAIVEEGHAAGLTVQAHTTSPESLGMEIEAGAKTRFASS
jgi:imidazolonepropionase-like amidohydrolase